LIMKECWILSKFFSPSIEIIMWFLSLLLLICCITFNVLHMLNYPCMPRMKLTWSWCVIFLIYCWIRFISISLRIFVSNSLGGWPDSFLLCPCLVLGWV
jgi:hypothetical protein